MVPFSHASKTTSDITELSELERLRIALSVDNAIVYDWSLEDDTIAWDGEVVSILQVKDLESLSMGTKFKSFMGPDAIALRENVEKNPSIGFTTFRIEYQFCVNGEEPYWLEDRGQRLFDENNNPVRIVGVLRVITDRKLREAQLNYIASYDDLTGQLNRARLRERLDHAIERITSRRGSGAYLVLGIDDLAIINADYGFDVADEVIVNIGERLRGAVSQEDQIGRTAGNKFGIIIEHCSEEEIMPLAQCLVDSVRNNVVETSAGPIPASASIGCVGLSEGAESSRVAMTWAEEALDRAKRSGRGSIEAFSLSREIESIRRSNAAIADRVVSALNDRRIRLAFQPIVSAQTQKVHGYECLIRMIDLDGEVEIAGNFIPQAEQLGLIRLIDRRVLELVTEVLYEHLDLHLALNVSGVTATEALCIEGYLTHIQANQAVADRMTIELTETSALRDMEQSVRFVSKLRDLGCKIAIDDFGAGYTSFRNLQDLAVDSVKIDGSFIRGLANNKDNQLFVRTLVDLARNFGIDTVAEFVTTQQEADLLREYGVDYLQGFYFGEPTLELETGLIKQINPAEQIIGGRSV